MCSIGEDSLDDNPMKLMKKEECKLFNKCNKCRAEEPCVVLRNKDAYCKTCFLAGATHRFKALLGKSRLILPNDQVLVCYEVGHPGTALLHFLRRGLDLNTPKKLRFDPVIIFIDDQYQLSTHERTFLIEQVVKQVKSFGFKLYIISFAEYVETPERIGDIITSNGFVISERCKVNLEEILYKRASKTCKNDLRRIFKRQLLIDAAKHLICKFVFTSEISNDVAYQLLTDVSLGRGLHIPIDTGFCDDRDADVKILRPLRLFDIKELAFYNKYNNIAPLYVRQLENNPYSSVQDLMKKFVSDLQVNFPATVTTIMKTGDKLSLEKTDMSCCKLCKGLLPRVRNQLISEESTNFSHFVSTTVVDREVSQQERYADLIDKFQNIQSCNRKYCYACTKLVKKS